MSALRLRTLPLATAPIVVAGGLAANEGRFHLLVWLLCLSTAVLLQIVSNLANDLGDALKGTDDEARQGPRRAVASGAISPEAMKRAVAISAAMAAASGIGLLAAAWPRLPVWAMIGMALVGLLAIAAALAYTLGKRPYGYRGLGEASVVAFFGLAGVTGAHLLVAGGFSWSSLPLGLGIGLLAAGVLSINNIRDRAGDERHGKRTLAVVLGDAAARRMHWLIVCLGAVLVAGAPLWTGAWQAFPAWLPMAALPLLVREALKVAGEKTPAALNPRLGALSLATALAGGLAGLGLALA
jgi:1,4-dihydroxy-2-naphthoate octaprenyltransferase